MDTSCKLTIGAVMKPCPYVVNHDEPVDKIIDLMTSMNFRRAPVVQDGELIGILNLKDAKMCSVIYAKAGIEITAGDICHRQPVIVQESDEIGTVARIMYEGKHDCVLVGNDDDELVGLFTTTDVCRLLFLMYQENKTLCERLQEDESCNETH